jgi:hypothetical protein
LILVFASEFDSTAQDLVVSWPGKIAALLTPNDLVSRGWRISLEEQQGGTIVAGGRALAVEDISGVITRLPGIVPRELYRIAPEDRAYVAAEITALLVYWLNSLSCPVLNRPSPLWLAGANLRDEQWTMLAAQCGIPVRSCTLSTARAPTEIPAEPVRSTVVIGRRVLNGGNQEALALAERAGVELLEVRFVKIDGREYFAGVSLLPDLALPGLRAALYERFAQERR